MQVARIDDIGRFVITERPIGGGRRSEMDLDELIDGAVGRGRRKAPLFAEVARPLEEGDLLALNGDRGVSVRPLTQIRQSHHALARALATGMSQVEASAVTGYSLSRISILKDDPAFQELLAHYGEMKEIEYADMHARLAALGFDSIEVLHERLLDNPDSFAPETLLKIVDSASDRTGYGKTSNVNLKAQVATLSAADLERIRNNSSGENGTAKQISAEDRRALLRLAVSATGEVSSPEGPEGGEGSGPGLREESDPSAAAEVPDAEVSSVVPLQRR